MYYLNRRPDGQEEVTVEDLKEERNDDILQHYEHLANYAEQSETGKGTNSSGTYVYCIDLPNKVYAELIF